MILILVSFVGLSKVFEKTNLNKWQAYIPIYNFWLLSKLLQLPKYWAFIMIIPGVNIIMYGVYAYHLSRAFRLNGLSHVVISSILPYVQFVNIGFSKNLQFIGKSEIKKESKFIKNWIDPLLYAVVVASIIRGFFLEAFTIPTSSLEKSLMVGDFLFVNKTCFGAKIPQTPIAFPFAHHTLPWTEDTKSYLEWIKIPLMRLPGYTSPKKGDYIVFNYPDGDTIATGFQNMSYYQLARYIGYQNINNPNYTPPFGNGQQRVGKIVARPIDKREFYVKRCVASAGDILEIKNGEIYINNNITEMPIKAQHHYFIKAKSDFVTIQLLDKYDIYYDEAYKVNLITYNNSDSILSYAPIGQMSGHYDDTYLPKFKNTFTKNDTVLYNLNMTIEVANKIKQLPDVYSVIKEVRTVGDRDMAIFPHNSNYAWNNDQFGPFLIPQKGLTIKLDTTNICLYAKILSTYDDGLHQITKNNNQVLYDGKLITSYTFKQDYYWMMGDNRHNSADSRSWGVVPFDHIIGKPVFVWFSKKDANKNLISGKSIISSLFKNEEEGKFRWSRFLCYVSNEKLISLKLYVLLIVIIYYGYKFYKKRKPKTT